MKCFPISHVIHMWFFHVVFSQQQLLNLTQSCEKTRTSQRSAERRKFSSGTLITPENDIHSLSFLCSPYRRIVQKLGCQLLDKCSCGR